LLSSGRFVGGGAKVEKVVQALHCLGRQREVKFADQRVLVQVVRGLVEGETPRITQAGTGYLATLVHSLNRLKFKDKAMWSQVAVLVSRQKNLMDTRSLANVIYSFGEVKNRWPQEFVFDSILAELELPVVKALLEGDSNP